MRKFLLAACSTIVVAAFGGVGMHPGHALASYGQGAQYQIEISANCNGLQSCVLAKGDGLWLWIELTPAYPGATWGTGDYVGADCVHGLVTPTGTFSGAASDSGDVTWTSDGTTLTISGAMLIGGEVPVTITVPAGYGHYVKAEYEITPDFPVPGVAQVQVAP